MLSHSNNIWLIDTQLNWPQHSNNLIFSALRLISYRSASKWRQRIILKVGAAGTGWQTIYQMDQSKNKLWDPLTTCKKLANDFGPQIMLQDYLEIFCHPLNFLPVCTSWGRRIPPLWFLIVQQNKVHRPALPPQPPPPPSPPSPPPPPPPPPPLPVL